MSATNVTDRDREARRRESQGPRPRPTIMDVRKEGGRGAVMQPTDPKELEKHIKAMAKGTTSRVIKGVENLKKAASEVRLDKPQLRRGQLIFGTVSLAHDAGIDDTPMGTIANWLTPALTKYATNQTRWYAYLHVAVYAGQFRGTHYIIENGGTSRGKIGYVPYCGYEIVLNILKTSQVC